MFTNVYGKKHNSLSSSRYIHKILCQTRQMTNNCSTLSTSYYIVVGNNVTKSKVGTSYKPYPSLQTERIRAIGKKPFPQLVTEKTLQMEHSMSKLSLAVKQQSEDRDVVSTQASIPRLSFNPT